MSAVEQVRILCDGKADYRIINKRDLKDSDVLWSETDHIAKHAPKKKSKKKAAKKR